ncbi:MAG: hypothetical protein P8J37_10970 [Fuerstiella sp.]|nr:hypothetical protein [Fuerstiella sp.]
MRPLTISILVVFLSAAANACNVPVFRYALERWAADPCEVVVFHDGKWTQTQQAFVQQLQTAAVGNSRSANIEVLQQNIADDMDRDMASLWEEQGRRSDVPLPHIVVRSSVAGRTMNHWRGSINDTMQAGLLSSPARHELSQRLLTGHSAVWLVLNSNDEDRNQSVVRLLNEQLKQLGQEIPMPEGIGLPGSELFSDIPLLMKFSVLEIDPSDESEQFLAALLTGFEPDAISSGEPLVVPVFGRGRALEVIPAEQLDAGLIEDLTLFLCGACSCQVKERNPGFDLLMTANWELELFGEGAEELTSQIVAASTISAEPVLIEIPAGSSKKREPAGIDKQSAAPLSNTEAWLSGGIICLVAVVIAIVLGHSTKI